MDLPLSSQLSSCRWVSPRRLVLCRHVIKRGISNASVTDREGVCITQGQCSSDGNGAGSSAVVNMSRERAEFLFLTVSSPGTFLPNRSVEDYLQCI